MAAQSKAWIFMLIIFIASLSQVSTDLYTPSLPAIAHYFNVHVNQVQFSLAVFVLGLAVTQLIYGPLSEGIGRRPTLFIGLSIALVGVLLCWFASSIHMLLLGRLIQGCGAGACVALMRAIFRDSFEMEEVARLGSYMGNVMVVTVVAAPFLGGLIQELLGWRAVFAVMALYTLMIFSLVILKFQESSQHHHVDRLKIGFIAKTYAEMLMHRSFMGYSLCAFLVYGGLFAWITSGPILLIKIVGISPAEFGALTLFIGIAMILGGITNARLVKRFGPPMMLRAGLTVMFFSGVLMLLLKFLLPMSVATVLLPAVIFNFGATLIFSNNFSLAFKSFGHVAGYAGALYGFIQTMGAAVFGVVLSHVAEHNQLPLSLMLIASPALAYAALRFATFGQAKTVRPG